MTQLINNIETRLFSKTPRVIRILQKIAASIGGLALVIPSVVGAFEGFVLHAWVYWAILGGVVINHLILQLFTEDDNKDK